MKCFNIQISLLNVSFDLIHECAAEHKHFFDAGSIECLQGVIDHRGIDQRQKTLITHYIKYNY